MAQPATKKNGTTNAPKSQPHANNDVDLSTRKLFGGAFEIELPNRFIDLSTFRSVPDHQEVWSDAHTDRSLIVELNERVQEQSDETAAKYHFQDIARVSDSCETKIVSTGMFPCNNGVAFDAVAKKYHSSWTFGTQKVSKGRDSIQKANVIALYLVLIRMKEFDTDLLISFNAPIAIHDQSQSKSAQATVQPPQQTMALFQRIVSTFKINDDELKAIFGTDQPNQ